MYKNILVPLDISHTKTPEKSIEVANSLLAEGGTVTLLNVVEELPGYIELQLPRETQARNIEESKLRLLAIADSHVKGAKCVVVVGHASQTILSYAKKNAADCIIIASHKPGLEDYLIGSTASRVVRHAKCAVHVIR